MCRNRFRLDKLDDPGVCPSCGSKDSFTEARQFNLMFKTHAGPVADEGAVAYLRPETAQGMFVNFANVLQTTRKKPPFGIAQVGKSFRNEITPRTGCSAPGSSSRWSWSSSSRPTRRRSGTSTGARSGCPGTSSTASPAGLLRLRAHDADELSHYSAGTSDVEFLFPWGFDELEGIANRTDYDLTQHAKFSGEKLDYFDQASGERYVPT